MPTHMAAMFQVTAPEPFNFSHSAEWEKWVRRFKRFGKAAELEEKGEEAQVHKCANLLDG